MAKRFDFDFAFSFAGEERELVEQIARSAQKRGLRVFYDRDHRASLWGKTTDEYDKIYGPRTRWFVPFLSGSYKKKPWPRYELSIALNESRKRTGEFILPVRIDDTAILGLPDDINYLTLQEQTPDDIVASLEEKLHSPRGRSRGPQGPLSVRLLTSQQRLAIGLIGTSIIATTSDVYQKLFPKLPWSRILRAAFDQGLVVKENGLLRPGAEVKKWLNSDREDASHLDQSWVEAILQQGGYWDLDFCLAGHYLRLGKTEPAIRALADSTERCNDLSWNPLHLKLWKLLLERVRALRFSSADTRWHLYNAAAISLIRSSEFDGAQHVLQNLRRYASRKGLRRAVGLSWLNAGVAYFEAGDDGGAIAAYRKAIVVARPLGDMLTVRRAQGNMAELLRASAPGRARELLQDNLVICRTSRDEEGRASAYAQLGHVEGAAGSHRLAIGWFEKSSKIASRSEMWTLQTDVLVDLCTAYLSLGEQAQALRSLRRAKAIAAKRGLDRPAIDIALREAHICFERRQLDLASEALSSVLDLARNVGDSHSEMVSLHGLAMVAIAEGRPADSRRLITKASRIAKVQSDDVWSARLIVDKCRLNCESPLAEVDIRSLRRAAQNEENAHRNRIAGLVWLDLAREAAGQSRGTIVEEALDSAERCLRTASAPTDELITACRQRCEWLQSRKDWQGLLVALEALASLGESKGRPNVVFDATEHHGLLLQDLGRFREAAARHKAAVRTADSAGDRPRLGQALNNLGEAHRKLGHTEKALEALEGSRSCCSAVGDTDGQLTADGNRALALLDSGDLQSAMKAFRACRDRARRSRLWGRYVDSIAGLAAVTWTGGDLSRARTLYRQALSRAQKHRVQSENMPRIALNYARLLEEIQENKAALGVLRKYADAADRATGFYEYDYTYGSLLVAHGNRDAGRGRLECGMQVAKSHDDRHYVALCAHALSECRSLDGDFESASALLRAALAVENEPGGRAILLSELMVAELQAGDKDKASDTFDEARELAERLNLDGVYITIHLSAGDHLWDKGAESRDEGLRMHTVALFKAMELDEQEFIHVAAHIITTLVSARPRPTSSTLLEAATQLSEWATDQADGDQMAGDLASWPVRVASKVVPYVLKSGQLDRNIMKVIQCEPLVLSEPAS